MHALESENGEQHADGAVRKSGARRQPPSLSELRRVHGVRRDGGPAFSRWWRELVARSLLDFADTSQVSVRRLSELTGIDSTRCHQLLTGTNRRAPSWRVVVKLIAAGVIDGNTGEPRMVLARQLRKQRHRKRSKRERWLRPPGQHMERGVARALIAWRRQRELTVAQAARELGCGTARVYEWERGAMLPAPNTLARLVELRIISREIAHEILDSGHFMKTALARTTPEALRIIRGGPTTR